MKKVLLLFLLMSLAIPAWAGSEMRIRLESISYPDDWVNVEALVEGDHVRLNIQGPWSEGSLIYDRRTSLITLVDDIHQIVLPVDSTMQMALKIMSYMASDEIKNAIHESPSAQLAYNLVEKNARALFEGRSVLTQKNTPMSGFVCDLYEARSGGKKDREVWMAPLSATGMSLKDNETLWNLTQRIIDLLGNELSQWGVDTTSFLQGYSHSSFPVHAAFYIDGKISSRWNVTLIRHRNFGPDTFNPPARYQRLSLVDLIKKGT